MKAAAPIVMNDPERRDAFAHQIGRHFVAATRIAQLSLSAKTLRERTQIALEIGAAPEMGSLEDRYSKVTGSAFLD